MYTQKFRSFSRSLFQWQWGRGKAGLFLIPAQALSQSSSSKFKVQGSRFKVRGSRFEVQGSRFKVRGSRFEVQGSRFEVQGSRFEVQGSRFRLPFPAPTSNASDS